MHPELALRERRKDPEFLRQKEEAWRALTNGINASAGEIFTEWKKRVLDAAPSNQ